MKTFYENLIAAGAVVKNVPNGTSVELLGCSYLFTEVSKEIGTPSCTFIYSTIPFTFKKPVVLVLRHTEWGWLWHLESKVPLNGEKYKVFV